ncbi:MAG: phenylalanine--tRNA ligase subunit alpha [Candidatus Micrarchaeia archaeon]
MVNGVDKIIESLSSKEEAVLKEIAASGNQEIEEISKKTGLQYSDVSRSILWLENKGLVKTLKNPIYSYHLTEIGEKYLKKGIVEKRIFDYLDKNNAATTTELMEELGIDENELRGGIGALKNNGIVEFGTINGKSVLILKNRDESKIKEYQNALADLSNAATSVLSDLAKRGIIEKKSKNIIIASATKQGMVVYEELKHYGKREIVDKLTPQMLIGNLWMNKKFKRYEIKSPVPSIVGGRKHPLYLIIDQVKEILISMGFRELEGNWIETAFWNMDSMFIPQNHPARDIQDTFYIGKEKGSLPEDLKNKVKLVQEGGWDTGSTGYMDRWDEEEAKKLVLRSHTTALTFRTFAEGISIPDKAFTIGRVFRNENPDSMHMPEFHQIEGFVVDRDLSIRDLIGYFTVFYKQLGITGLKFKPTYNPYTEPSMEIYTHHFGKLIEIGNSGIFRPESLRPYGIKANVIAWGLAVERLASIIYEINDIRKLYGSNSSIDFARNYMYKVYK